MMLTRARLYEHGSLNGAELGHWARAQWGGGGGGGGSGSTGGYVQCLGSGNEGAVNGRRS